MNRSVVAVAVGVALVALTSATVSRIFESRLSAAQADVITANVEAMGASIRADSALAELAQTRSQRDSMRLEVDRLTGLAAAQDSVVRDRLARLLPEIAVAPPECDSIIEALQLAAYDAVTVGDYYRQSTELLQAQVAQDTVVISKLEKTVRDQQQAMVRLREAAGELADRSQRPFLSRIIPEVGFGATFGVSALDGRPDAVIGVTLSWRP